MKTATLPALRVTPRLRRELEAVLSEDETISGFVEEAVRARLTWRRAQLEFLEKGLLEAERARANEDYVDARDVLARIDGVLRTAKATARRSRKRS